MKTKKLINTKAGMIEKNHKKDKNAITDERKRENERKENKNKGRLTDTIKTSL